MPQDEVWTFFLFMNLKVFEKNGWEIRTVVDGSNEPWFVLSDVCKALGLSNPTKVKSRLDEDGCKLLNAEELSQSAGLNFSNLGNPYLTFVNEANLYKCILRSEKKEAEVFQDWICKEVLPSIRKTGVYLMDKQDESFDELMSRALAAANEVLKKREERLKKVERENERITEENRILNCDNKLLKYNVDIQNDIVEESMATQERFYDFFNTDETYTATQIGDLIGRSAIWVNRLLRDNKLMKKVGNQYVPIPELVRKGYARQVATRSYKGGIPNTFFTYRWTAKGVAFIKQLYIKHECNNPHSLMGNTPPGKLDIELTLDEMDSFISPVNRGNNRRR